MAIKLLRLDTKLNDREVQRFQRNLVREAHILAKLRHTHIGQAFTVIQDPLGVVIEWVEGISLRDVINAGEQKTLLDVINRRRWRQSHHRIQKLLFDLLFI